MLAELPGPHTVGNNPYKHSAQTVKLTGTGFCPFCCVYKGKSEGRYRTGLGGPGGVEVSSTLSLPSVLGGKDPIPLHKRLGGPQGRSGQTRNIWSPHRVSIPGPSRP